MPPQFKLVVNNSSLYLGCLKTLNESSLLSVFRSVGDLKAQKMVHAAGGQKEKGRQNISKQDVRN